MIPYLNEHAIDARSSIHTATFLATHAFFDLSINWPEGLSIHNAEIRIDLSRAKRVRERERKNNHFHKLHAHFSKDIESETIFEPFLRLNSLLSHCIQGEGDPILRAF